MVITFVGKRGHVATVMLTEQRTVTAKWYCTVCLPEVFENLCEQRPKSGLRGLFCITIIQALTQQVQPETSLPTNPFKCLAIRHILLALHPTGCKASSLYFFVFAKVKDLMRGSRFSSPSEAADIYKEHLETLTKFQWCNMIEKWCERMKKCIQARWEYFEKI
ncbi:hypothetical protein LOD99_5614 [Oopsacas minuta]|uniref:Mariner Mos1 transposase n=1 Tax=Oopsacas minuta TaxID=111878 RepID=A0AAV7JQD9_9METZ|nr:hypothetical protein LOD99_5614 [Oopsacas minuta]